jgi:hypothetical protein
MATSTCVKCNGTKFETKEATPKNSNFILTFVQCSSCGGVVGAMDALNLGAELQDLKRQLVILKNYIR